MATKLKVSGRGLSARIIKEIRVKPGEVDPWLVYQNVALRRDCVTEALQLLDPEVKILVAVSDLGLPLATLMAIDATRPLYVTLFEEPGTLQDAQGLPEGVPVCLIDDVVTSGSHANLAYCRLGENGFNATQLIVLFDNTPALKKEPMVLSKLKESAISLAALSRLS